MTPIGFLLTVHLFVRMAMLLVNLYVPIIAGSALMRKPEPATNVLVANVCKHAEGR